MKPWIWTALVAIALVVMVGVEESRIGKLAKRIGVLEKELAAVEVKPAKLSGGRKTSSSRMLASRQPRQPRPAERTERMEEEESGGLQDSFRKMAENPAGRAMMNQGIKAMSAMWYGDLVRGFELSREEEDYFLGIVAGSMSEQQAVGMKMMGAKDAAEGETLKAEMEKVKEDEKQAVKEFLADDEDYATFEAYAERLPERQQLDGLRAVMSAAEAPLSAEQEAAVIDAMYAVRTSEGNTTDWNGPGGMDAIASGEATTKFEDEWARNSGAMAEAVGEVLDEAQVVAFKGYQEQMKEMQMMGIKMAEQMFQKNGGAEGGE